MSELSYTIYEPRRTDKNPLNRADQLVFVREGFSFWAMIAPPLWMIYHGLWRALLGFFILIFAIKLITWLFALESLTPGLLIISLFVGFGFLANDLRRFFLEKDGFQMIGAITGPSQLECERRFFHTWRPLANHLQQEQNG